MGSVVDAPPATQANSHAVSLFPLVSRPSEDSDPNDAPTSVALTEELLLLSWLIVLLRTREDIQFGFDWAYGRENGVQDGPVEAMRLSANEVLTGLDNEVSQVAAAISRHITSTAPRTRAPGSVSLLLSTGSLSQVAEGTAKDEPLLHVETRFDDELLQISPVWHTKDMLPFTVTRHVENLADTVKLCLSNPEAPIQSLLGPTAHDLDQIWGWNHEPAPTYDFCMHDVISERAQRHPDKVAISSWDGSLTYGQIDRYSTFIARALKTEMGVELHDFVPVCFEKSRWTIVAVLAVMKVGATMVLMDPTLPLPRLQNMAKQVGAKAMVSSRDQRDFSGSIMPDGQFIVVEESAFTTLSSSEEAPEAALEPLPTVPPSALMYIIFTSGSTGTPKGVKISHRTYSSSAIPRAAAVGYNEDSRVLDFASYAFDVSIDSMLLTLANGGCLCIPSDEDRLNDINGVMKNMRVNYAGITPSVARILDIDVIASLSALGLGGEAASALDVNRWGQYTRIVIGYGPCECTIGCTVNSNTAKGRDYISIGAGNGACMWVADPNDHEVLMPVGAVGELLVEGPIVGQGYLNDPEKTAAAFIEDPSWLTAGHGSFAGRRGRLYKTGDLGRFDPDGSGEIVFVGRKDTQVKLRGQRVELGEIESQLRARLPQDINVIAEVIVPVGSSQGQPTLVAFVASQAQSAKAQEQNADLEYAQDLHQELREALAKADAEIAEVLPRYMVPTAYIPVNRTPTLISGKTDRKRLREFGAKVDIRHLTARKQEPKRSDTNGEDRVDRPLTEMEQRLRKAWALTLKREPDAIRHDDNFFALGGDSLAAMRLVSACRERGLDLSVTSTFGNPTLSAMASTVVGLPESDSQATGPVERSAFSLIPQPSVESAIFEASQVCGIEQARVEDIYPCTPTQESLFTFSLKSAEAYIAQRVACIPSHISLDDWKRAWEAVVAETPVLRSRLIHLNDHSGLSQVVLNEGIDWKHAPTELAQFLETDKDAKMNLGESLARYAIIDPPSSSDKRYMVWTLHHAVYDGWSEPLVLEKVRNALRSTQSSTPNATMGDFVKYVIDTDKVAMQDFWRRELQGADGPQFPRVPSRDFVPTPDTLLERHIALKLSTSTSEFPFTLATLIRGAWALVASQYSGNDDVVFGETLMGRDIPLPGVEGIVGPLVATVPVRVRIDRASSIASYLQTVQLGMLARTSYQHMGMQNIRKVSREAQYACEAPTGLVIQPEPEQGVAQELGFELGDVVREAIHFNPYPLMLASGIQKGGFRVCANFDSSLVEPAQMERILAQLETACFELTKNLSRRLDQVSCLPAVELNQIWSWNRTPPSLRADAAIVKPGSVYQPRVAVPWVCDPRNPSLLSPIGCPGELWFEGPLSAADVVAESPAWLLAGSAECAGRPGKVHPTGDIVKLQEDGSLVFVAQKEGDVSAQGHTTGLTELEVHFKTYLPPSVRAAAAVVQGTPGQEVIRVVVVEQPQASEQDANIALMPEGYTIVSDDLSNLYTGLICGAAPTSLIAALKRLDKFAQNSLASHLVPSAYVVIDKLFSKNGQVDRNLLAQFASKIPRKILDRLREGFQEAWSNSSLPAQTTTMTPAEGILQSSWAKILGLAPEQIDVDDNFFRLGGDSVLAMKLVSYLRTQGHGLSVADIFRHMRLSDAAKVLKVNQFEVSSSQEIAAAQPYKPFSLLGSVDAEQFVTEVVHPKLGNAGWSAQDVYPVTDSQALDVRATVQPPRTSVQFTVLTYSGESNVDQERLIKACRDLVEAHDILRTVFIEHDSTLLQVVLKDLIVPFATYSADENETLEKSVHDLCREHLDSGSFQLGRPLFHMFLVKDKRNQDFSLVLGLSHAQYDGVSLPSLLRDLEALYTGKPIIPSTPFSSYLAQTRSERAQTAALNYWSTLLAGSSLSILNGQPSHSTTTTKALFRSNPVPGVSQPPQDITTASLLTAAWSVVLARRLATADVTFGSITSGRGMPWLADAESVMGPCYQFTPVRVQFRAGWTAGDLLGEVQRQGAEAMGYDFVGFEKIAERVGWVSGAENGEAFFDSVVHHQDWEEFETMPFAGGECKVDIVNPDGDAAYPVKVVSFVRDGGLHVGVVGSEADGVFVDEVLGELTGVVRELVEGGGLLGIAE